MITDFFDTTAASAHDLFQHWRTTNQDGAFLTLETRTNARLHGARCQHLGSGPPYYTFADLAESLTAKRKVCGPEQELLDWAREHGVTVARCRHCDRDGLIGRENLAFAERPGQGDEGQDRPRRQKEAFLVTWNARRWLWPSMSADIAEFRRSGLLRKRWSCGRTRRIERGDRVYLMRLGLDPKGIVGSGFVTLEPHEGEHWDRDRAAEGDGALFVEVGFDQLSEDPLLDLADLEEPPFAEMNWTPQGSGIGIPPAVSDALDAAWTQRTGAGVLHGPDEVVADLALIEGALQTVTVNAYERNADARRRCLAHYGHRCFACDFSFEEVYGDYVRQYIHVHHVVPVSAIGQSYIVDPIRDLRPLCPNCHAAIHQTAPIISPEEMRERIRAPRQRSAEASEP